MNLDLNTVCYIVGTLFFAATMVKQFYIIVQAPPKDKYFTAKIILLVFNLMILLTTWMLYSGYPGMAVPFFIAAGIIGFCTYFLNIPKFE